MAHIAYTKQGNYLLPDLKLPEQPKVEIGIWGKRRLRYLKNHHPIIYTNYLTSCTLTAHLADIDEEAAVMFERLVRQIAKQEGEVIAFLHVLFRFLSDPFFRSLYCDLDGLPHTVLCLNVYSAESLSYSLDRSVVAYSSNILVR